MAPTKKIVLRKDSGPSAKKAPKARTPKTVATSATELPIFDMAGKKVGVAALPPKIFSATWRPDLVHQVTTALAANKRQNRAHTKDRAEVAGGGRKPWRQKGTGQARHGSTRSPLWRHGGVTFGPRTERDYHEKVNQKMKQKALASILARKAQDGELVLVDKLIFATPKTREAIAALAALSKAAKVKLLAPRGNRALVALSRYDGIAVKSFRNLGGVATEEARNINPLMLLSYKYLVVENPDESFKVLASRI